MRRFASAAALSLVFALPAAAEQLTPQHKPVDDDATLTITLPTGKVEISRNTVEGTGLFVQAGGSHEVLLESRHLPQLLKTQGNSALLQLNTGDAQCPTRFAWVSLDDKGLRTSGSFGTCAKDASASLEGSDAGPVLVLKNREYENKTVSYRYNEATAELTRAMQP